MNARSPEEESSNNHIERQMNGGALPSLKLLDEILGNSDVWSEYLDQLIEDRYPAGGRDLMHANSERVQNRKISRELRVYESGFLGNNLSKLIDQHRAFSLIDPDARPTNNKLTPHIINQYIMPSLDRVFVSPKIPPQKKSDIKVSQIQLAVESVSILQYQQSIDREDGSYLDKQLFDIDAMIKQLGYIALSNKRGVPGMVVIPNPHYDVVEAIRPTPEFLVFTPHEPNGFDISETTTTGTLEKNAQPGDTAKEVLSNVVIHEIAPRLKKDELGALIMARRAIVQSKKESPNEDS